jgi:hypothetical protein
MLKALNDEGVLHALLGSLQRAELYLRRALAIGAGNSTEGEFPL